MIYKKLKKYASEKLLFAFLGIFCAFIAALFSVLSYYYIYRFLEQLIVFNDIDYTLRLALKIVLFLVVSTVVYFLAVLSTHILAFRLETNLKKEGIKHLMQASFGFYDKNESGRIRKIIDDNTALTHMSVAHLIPDLSTAVFLPFLGGFLAFYIDYRLGILFVSSLIFGLLLINKMMGDRHFMMEYLKAIEKMNSGAVEFVRGINVLKIFKTDVVNLKDFYNSVIHYSDLALRYSMSCRNWYVLFQVFFNTVFLIAIFIFYVAHDDAKVMLTKFMFYVVFNGIIYISFMKIMYVGMYVMQSNQSIEKIEQLFTEMEEQKLVSGSLQTFEDNSIEFKNVSFGYEDNTVIENLSFKLEEGKTYALVGSSGSGKSTIAKLISGFYRLNEGHILLGRHALEEYSSEALSKNIAHVFQDAKLFKKTIYENVQLGNPKASYQEVMSALHLAQCDDILAKFSDREKTLIGARGVHLSGGEVQRIAIARAILKNAKIVIMDEASAAADPENEFELQKALSNLMRGKTVIMIAHRLSSIKNVDEIIVIEQGRIIERGNHELLMGNNSRYKRLQEEFICANEWRVR